MTVVVCTRKTERLPFTALSRRTDAVMPDFRGDFVWAQAVLTRGELIRRKRWPISVRIMLKNGQLIMYADNFRTGKTKNHPFRLTWQDLQGRDWVVYDPR